MLGAFGCLAPGILPAQSGAVENNRLEVLVDSLAEAAIAAGPLAGLSIGVGQGNDVLVAKGYGYADLENDVPATAQTVYRIGSITKQFTALAILELRERGLVSLDDAITKFLPGYSTQGHRVTVHHLLTHTSGIRSYTTLGPDFWGGAVRLDLSHEQPIDMFEDEPFDFPPGERWKYNNSGYYLLGVIVERATGEPYRDYVERHVFQPLGMRGSSYCDERTIVPHRAAGYALSDGILYNDGPISMNVPGAAGALCSTVLDLLKWQRALNDDVLISEESRRRMTAESTLGDGSGTRYAYGLGVRMINGRRVLTHAGGINGFSTILTHCPEDDLTVAVLANVERSGPARLARAIGRAALGLPLSAGKATP